ncbi:MAG: T9SS type A sorting domain-containing protein [Bacteroidales bacterium]|nr:MAG: T9SS type A sorting domain-containing protein [Bacteroidales bacterium]
MKRLLFLMVIVKISLSAISQEIITSSGDSYSNDEIILSWTIGECVTETFTGSENTITQGFQQSNYSIVTLFKSQSTNVGLNVFPVPATNYLEIKITGENAPGIGLSLIDIYGNILIFQDIISDGMIINIESLSSGVYILKAVDKNGKFLKSFRIVKN